MSIFKFLNNILYKNVVKVIVIVGLNDILYEGDKSDMPDNIMYGDYNVIGINSDGNSAKLYVEKVL